jgi:hypothetical protein
MFKRFLAVAACVAAASASGCFAPSTTGDDDGGDDQAADLAEYDALQRELDGRRTELEGDQAMDPFADGGRVFWLEFPAFDPVLHGYHTATGERTTYAFSIGTGDRYDYRTSATAIATPAREGDIVRYSIYAVDAPGELIDQLEMPAPTDGQRWWAYALVGDVLYVMTTGTATTLYRYAPGGSPSVVTTLESAGCTVGELWDFTVKGQRAIVIESGRIWSVDLAANQATWLGNETEARAAIAEADGVVILTASGPMFYRYDSAALVDVGAAIAASDYQLNPTFAAAHHYLQDIARYRSWFVYIAQSGVFAYDLYRGEIRPLLLSPRTGTRIDYRYPGATADGSVFVTGLTSEDGAVGAEGPLYRVDAAAALE